MKFKTSKLLLDLQLCSIPPPARIARTGSDHEYNCSDGRIEMKFIVFLCKDSYMQFLLVANKNESYLLHDFEFLSSQIKKRYSG